MNLIRRVIRHTEIVEEYAPSVEYVDLRPVYYVDQSTPASLCRGLERADACGARVVYVDGPQQEGIVRPVAVLR